MNVAASPSNSLLRIVNGVRKVAAGLRPFNESVWPGVRNDLFVAHQSIYQFASQHVADKSVLDAGCGTGYGASYMANAGAASVLGIDVDRWSIRYARRTFGAPNLRFERSDIERLTFPPRSFDIVVASNSLEHLRQPEAFASGLHRVLTPEGLGVVAVPPIVTSADSAVHGRIHYHRSNLHVTVWADVFARANLTVECFSHRGAHSGVLPEFASAAPSNLTTNDFVFVSTDVAGLCSEPSITAVFILRRAG